MSKKTKCPECGKEGLEKVVIPSHAAKLDTIEFSVENAVISKCPSCGKTSVSLSELKRWREFQQHELRKQDNNV